MPNQIFYVLLLITFFLLELFYFRFASKNSIIDKPNERSSHSLITLRGGGIIFPLATFVWFLLNFSYFWFVAGVLLISVVSFWDDIRSLPNGLRITIHFISVFFLITQVNIPLPFYLYVIIFVLIIGVINAYNFMDGINGITGAYSLLTIVTLYFINSSIIHFTSTDFLIVIGLSLFVFNFFNFRNKAKCFAGDVGSVSMAFIICFLLIQLITVSQNFIFLGLLLVYGLDTVTTILFRLARKENIFKAHRSHFYQHLANERKWPHLLVSGFYSLLQLLINIGLIIYFQDGELKLINAVMILFLVGVVFAVLRLKIEGIHLIQNKNHKIEL